MDDYEAYKLFKEMYRYRQLYHSAKAQLRHIEMWLEAHRRYLKEVLPSTDHLFRIVELVDQVEKEKNMLDDHKEE